MSTRDYLHCKERALERYDLRIIWDDWQELNARIYYEDGVEFIAQPNKFTSIYRVRFRNRVVVVMFSEVGGIVTTFLPPYDPRQSGWRFNNKPLLRETSLFRRHRLRAAKASPLYGNINLIDENEAA